MNTIVTKSVSLNLLIFAITKKIFKIEYLEPINSIFIKNLVKIMEKFSNYRFKKVKMGKIKTYDNERLLKIAVARTNTIFKNIRLSIKKNSNSPIFDLFNDQILKEKWVDIIAKELVFLYVKEIESTKEKNEKIIIFKEKKNFYFEFSRKLNNIITIEIFRIIVNCSSTITNILLKKNKSKFKHIEVEQIFLASEPLAKNDLDYSLRNQQVLSENISGNSSYCVIDLFKMRFYGNKFNRKIEKSSFLEFLSIFKKLIPPLSIYNKIKYNLEPKYFLKSLNIIFNIWSVAKDIKTAKFVIADNSHEGSCMLILASILEIPSYIFQYSLLTQVNPLLHSPYANIIGFTNKHIENYNKESVGFNTLKTDSLKIDYPYLSKFDYKRIEILKKKLTKNFDLSIAFFDENYCRENVKDHAVGSFFYEDFKKELEIILTIAKLNPRVAIVFKSQFISNTIVNLIKKDKNLKKLFVPNQIFDISITTHYNDRNIITPAEIAQSVDLSVSSTLGGTAGFEASTVDCRTIFIKSGLSTYDNLIPNNATINDLSELDILLKKVCYSRALLYKSNIGKLEKSFIKNI